MELAIYRRSYPRTHPKRIRGALLCTLVALLFSAGLTVPVLAADGDGDGVNDRVDNCLNSPNPNQIDTDGDGCGNACDADYDQSGMVDADDFQYFRSVMGRKEGDANFDPNADHNDDGKIGGSDFVIFRGHMNLEPGPSLVANRDTRACP